MANYTENGHKRSGGDSRPTSTQRRKQKEWLLSPESGFKGNGETVPCVHCGESLTFQTLERDRIIPGGSYARDNLQPSCRFDNASRSNRPDWVSPLQKNMQCGA